MPDPFPTENEFLRKAITRTEENISNDQYGVSELADDLGMSRSNLLRKIKKLSGLSVSQFIRQIRLNIAMEMLKENSFNVSEVSYKVGFSSTSYFIKCFREHYGFPPGELGRGKTVQAEKEVRSRQLAAIMFTDIEGYTALMQRDEEKALAYRSRHREVFNSLTHKFNGKILQYYGDGTLSTFNSAIDAVQCGIALQLAFLQDPHIPIRIGIHSGDIIFDENDIIGDGVNVASRIESLAIVGSVMISEKVFDEVKNQSDIYTASMGVFELKNMDKPIEVFAVTNNGLLVPEKDEIEARHQGMFSGEKRKSEREKRTALRTWSMIAMGLVLIALFFYVSSLFDGVQIFPGGDGGTAKKSIAVLPFINDSHDSTNIYIINGLMESVLNNLQQIEDLRVVSRTSVEKFRNNPKTISEIARELNVRYFVEGSGQKIGDQIMLHIQLIEASSDEHLWAQQYNRETKDIFNLQMEIARDIALQIEAVITPEEAERIEKVPTENLVAYDHFLKGMDHFYKGTPEGWEEAIHCFEAAIEHDAEFARAYADISISYFLLDAGQTEKQYSEKINYYADQALLFDPELPQGLVAKALFYMHNKEYEMAEPYLEKAHEYNPNSAMVIRTLSDFYANYLPNTEKYLEYALKGISLDIAANDSTTASYIYLHISNAFIQSGFVDEAEKYINKSIAYDSANIYSDYVKAYILFAGNRDLQQLKESLLGTLRRDSSRLDVLQEVGKAFYYLRDYESSAFYYKKFDDVRETYNLDIYRGEDAKIGLVFSEVGLEDESKRCFEDYKVFADNNTSIYKHLSQAAYFSYYQKTEQAIEQLRLFSQQDNYHYWMVIFIPIDPIFDPIKDHPEFKTILNDIEEKFWDYHEEVSKGLSEKGLI